MQTIFLIFSYMETERGTEHFHAPLWLIQSQRFSLNASKARQEAARASRVHDIIPIPKPLDARSVKHLL